MNGCRKSDVKENIIMDIPTITVERSTLSHSHTRRICCNIVLVDFFNQELCVSAVA